MSSTHGLLHAVQNGLGLAFVSEISLVKDICGKEVKGVPIIDLVVEKDFFFVHKQEKRQIESLIKTFIEVLDKYNFNSLVQQ